MSICYSKSFVAFLDVLGFSEMVKKNKIEKIEKYFSIVNEAISQIKSIKEKKDIKFIVISDSVILTIPKENLDSSDNNFFCLRQLCIAIGFIQQKLAEENIWIRGAISFGDTFIDEDNNQIVGPAYIDAYKLEDEIALYPRVILDSRIIDTLHCSYAQELIEKINKKNEDANKQYNDKILWDNEVLFNWNYQNNGIMNKFNQDTPLYIDYLSPIFGKNDGEKINKIIENISKSIYMDNRYYLKYRWVIDYMKILANKYYDDYHQPNYYNLLYKL